MRTSAWTGRGMHRLPPVLLDLHARWTSRVVTSKVNDVIQRAQRERPTPRNAGTLHYATQVSTGPPSFVVFGGANQPDPSYRRYIENRLRRDFHLGRALRADDHTSISPGTTRRRPGAAGERYTLAHGTWRSLVAHRSGGPGVAGSSPAVPTDGLTW